ncbi:MAG TPA: YqeG family HAD IIIA-type phosphatase [Clostridia bacterium]|nr:YqeG family HAD IIIA-type phosphatase [Clostridia bacterium]
MWLVPDKIFEKISDIDPAFIDSQGVKGLVLDIDNTMAPKHIPLPDETLKNWIRNIQSAGISLFVISNNRMNRVSRFAKALELPYIYSGMKPFPHSFRKAVREMNLAPEEVAAVGDQIYTDVMGARLTGIKAWLVSPVEPNESFFFRLRRRFEAPVVRRYYTGREEKKK